MSRKLLSALALVAAGSAVLCWSKYFGAKEQVLDREIVRDTLIALRKRFFSTLREISFIIQQMKTNSGFSQIKISEVIIKNGHNAERKLNAIQQHVLQQYRIKKSNSLQKPESDFEHSCNYYAERDMEIKILLQNLKIDLEMAMQGTLSINYNGRLPSISANQTLEIYKQVIQRRMEILQLALAKKQNENQNDFDFLNRQAQIEQFLQMNGIKDQNQANEKLLLSLIEYHYLNDSFFQLQMEQLENGLHHKLRESWIVFQRSMSEDISQLPFQ